MSIVGSRRRNDAAGEVRGTIIGFLVHWYRSVNETDYEMYELPVATAEAGHKLSKLFDVPSAAVRVGVKHYEKWNQDFDIPVIGPRTLHIMMPSVETRQTLMITIIESNGRRISSVGIDRQTKFGDEIIGYHCVGGCGRIHWIPPNADQKVKEIFQSLTCVRC